MLLNEDKVVCAKIVKESCNLFVLVAFLTGSDRVPILGMKSMKVSLLQIENNTRALVGC